MHLPRRAIAFAIIFAFALVMDQGSKAWARTLPTEPTGCGVHELATRHCHGVPQPVVEGYWDWELALNDGAAFSSFRGSQIVLSLIAFVALIALGVLAHRTTPEQRLRRAGYAMIAGGALGNLIDRVRDGAVTDFVRWRVHDHAWPIFNVADVVLVIGVALLLLETVLAKRRAATLAT